MQLHTLQTRFHRPRRISKINPQEKKKSSTAENYDFSYRFYLMAHQIKPITRVQSSSFWTFLLKFMII